jgi:hypothetical protein
MMKKNNMYQYLAHSRAFLERARIAADLFKTEDDVQQLVIAALMLRFGIEARLFEYIEAALPAATRREQLMRISEYQASKLLSRLTRLNPKADGEVIVTMRSEDGGEQAVFRYTPVTDSLASLHGRLGELLHFNYFRKNPYWYMADRVDAPGLPTVLHAFDLVERAISELAEATSGALLSHPQFRRIVQQVVEDINAGHGVDPQASDTI